MGKVVIKGGGGWLTGWWSWFD